MRVAPLLLLALAACGRGDPPQPVPAAPAPAPAAPIMPGWRAVATPSDRARLRDWRKAWLAALPQARTADAKGVAAQGALFTPDLALGGAAPPPGAYRCRVFKLGAKGAGMRGFTAYPAFDCTVEGAPGALSFTKRTGSQRPAGRVFADSEQRAVFLGTMVFGDERGAIPYGTDHERDMAGWIERIGPKRWRVVLPYPRFESVLDVVELVPADAAKTP